VRGRIEGLAHGVCFVRVIESFVWGVAIDFPRAFLMVLSS
jgi:hypothetical protein